MAITAIGLVPAALDAAVPGRTDESRPRGRLAAVDACRGVAVVGMLVANLLNVFLHDVPPVLRHNQGDTLRLFDFPAPLFQFLVGLSLPLFLASRQRRGLSAGNARREAVQRFMLLIGLGMLLDAVAALHLVPRWGVLQTLGLGGIAATLLEGAPLGVSVATGLALLTGYSGLWNGVVHQDVFASLAFVPLTLAGLLVGRGRTPDAMATRALTVGAVALLLATLTFAAGVPFNKVTGTSSFVALAIAAACATLALLVHLERHGHPAPGWLTSVGANALTAWVLLHVLVYYPAWLGFPDWQRLGLPSGLLAMAAVTSLLSVLTLSLCRRGLRVPL